MKRFLKYWLVKFEDFFEREKGKEPWQIAAARYCVENAEKGFDQKELEQYIKSLYKVSDGHLNQFWEEEIHLPSGRQFSRNPRGNWIPPLDLVSKITDFDELQEARESSRKAMLIATGSLFVAIIVGIVQIVVGIIQILE